MITRGTPIIFYQSLNRQFFIMGVNQKLFFLFIPFWLPVAFAWGFKPVMDLVAFCLFAIFHGIGVILTRIDNQILDVYNRHRRYRPYYSSFAGIHAPTRKVQMSVPFYEGKRGLV